MGRGCIAGDVFACAAMVRCFEGDFFEKNVKDSKKISIKKRFEIEKKLREYCVFAIGRASIEEIHELNILNATMLAMNRAIDSLADFADVEKCKIIVDGNKKPRDRAICVIKGDAKFYEIAAASILAKTARDRYMVELSESFPEYGFERNFGYGTAGHFSAIKKHGLTKIHRSEWIKIDQEKIL